MARQDLRPQLAAGAGAGATAPAGRGDKPQDCTLNLLLSKSEVHPRPFEFLHSTVFQIPFNSKSGGGSAGTTAVGNGSTVSLQDFLSGI